ncbi:RNA polymerase sigma factor [Nocardia gipuzkoensis]
MAEPELLDQPEQHGDPDPSALRRRFEADTTSSFPGDSLDASVSVDRSFAEIDAIIHRKCRRYWLECQQMGIEIDDLAQEVWGELLTSKSFDFAHAGASGWIGRLAQWTLSNLRRARKENKRGPDDEYDEELHAGINATELGTVDGEIDLLDPIRRICTFVGLSENQTKAVLLEHSGLDCSYDQIAAALDTTPANVRQLLSRAHRKINQVIGLTEQEKKAVRRSSKTPPLTTRQSDKVLEEPTPEAAQQQVVLESARHKIRTFLHSCHEERES